MVVVYGMIGGGGWNLRGTLGGGGIPRGGKERAGCLEMA